MDAQARKGSRHRWAALLLLGALVVGPGCLHLDRIVEREKMPSGPRPTRVVMAWVPRVEQTPDPTRGGTMSPGLVSRLYLFDEGLSFPMVCEGVLQVEMYDLSKGEAKEGCELPRLGGWTYGPNDLHKCLKQDMFGQGYTLFFPWPTYRNDISRVQLRTTFTPAGGTALYAGQPTVLNLATPFATRMNPHGPVAQNIETKSMKPLEKAAEKATK